VADKEWPSALGPVACIVGARPNFMKMAPILRAFSAHRPVVPTLLVPDAARPYRPALRQGHERSAVRRPASAASRYQPRGRLGNACGADGGGHAPLRAPARRDRPSCVLVVGDVNSTLACALVCAKKLVPVVHVEAGLRSHDRAMPEEINRVLTDQLADRLYTTERSAHDNLAREGVWRAKGSRRNACHLSAT